MFYRHLAAFNERPEPFSRITTRDLWTDPHVAERMLACHLDESNDLASRRGDAIESTLNWIDRRIGLPGRSVCDLGCGPGLYALRMARRGASVTGIDFSTRSLAHARRAAASAGVTADFREADYLTDPLPGGQDLVCVIYCDVGVMAPDTRRRFLARVRAMLRPGGCFVFDLFPVAAFAERRAESTYGRRFMDGFWAAGDYFGFKTTFLYEDLSLALDRYLIVAPERTREVFNWFQYLDPDAVTPELEAAGFAVDAVVDVVTGEPWQGGTGAFALVARA